MEQECIFCKKDITYETKYNPFPLEGADKICCLECLEHLVKPAIEYGRMEALERERDNGFT